MSLRRRITCMAAGVFWLASTGAAFALMPVNEYLALRAKLCPKPLAHGYVKQDPFSFKGRTIEIRGTVQGVISSSAGTRIIVRTLDGEDPVINVPKDSGMESGSQICALVTIGDKCQMSMSDLQLAGATHLSQVMGKERQAEETKRKAQIRKQATARAMNQSKMSERAANTRATVTTSRGATDIYSAYRNAIAKFNKKLSPSEVDAITASILEFSRRNNVDPRLVIAVILAESHFNPSATSHCGAMGLGQLMPGTAKGMGVSNAYDPVANIEAAVRLIKGHLTKYSGSSNWNDLDWSHIQLALASYNAGPGAVKKYKGVPPYRETQGYIKKVISYYKDLCGID